TGDAENGVRELCVTGVQTWAVPSGTTTGITVDGVAATESQNIGLASLNALAAGGTISFVNHDSTFQSLTATATTDITFDAGRTLTAAAGSLTLTAPTGTTSDTGALTLAAKDGVTMNSTLTHRG